MAQVSDVPWREWVFCGATRLRSAQHHCASVNDVLDWRPYATPSHKCSDINAQPVADTRSVIAVPWHEISSSPHGARIDGLAVLQSFAPLGSRSPPRLHLFTLSSAFSAEEKEACSLHRRRDHRVRCVGVDVRQSDPRHSELAGPHRRGACRARHGSAERHQVPQGRARDVLAGHLRTESTSSLSSSQWPMRPSPS